MKVDIKREEDVRGMFKKTTHYKVTLRVEFNEEEKAVIKKNNMEDLVIVQRDLMSVLTDSQSFLESQARDPHYSSLRVRHLIKGKGEDYYLASNHEANAYVQELKEKLSGLKNMLEGNTAPVEDESFEL